MNSFKIFPSILESVKLAYKHKILWVFALAVTGATYTSQFTFFNEVDPSQSNDTPNEISSVFSHIAVSKLETIFDPVDSNKLLASNIEEIPTESIKEDDSNIQLNDSEPTSDSEPVTLSSKDYVFFQALQIIQTLGPKEYLELFFPNLIVLLLSLLIGLISAIGVNLVATSWAYSGLVKGCLYALQNKEILLKELSDFGILNWLQLIKLKLLGVVLLITMFFVSFVFVISPIVILPKGNVAVILATLLFLAALIVLTLLHYSLKFGHFFVLLHKQNFKEALINGFLFAKMYIWKTLLLEFVSGALVLIIVSFLLGLLRVIATFGVLYYPAVVEFVFANLALIIPVSLFVGVLGSAIMLFIVVFSGFISTYTNILWTKFFVVLETSPKEVTENA